MAKTTCYPPLKDTGDEDDEITIQRNYDKLQKELAEKNPKKEIVLALARQTFSFQRRCVLSDNTSVLASQLLDKFGELNKVYVVSETLDTWLDMYSYCALIFQIQQDIDLVLTKRDTFKLALADWQTKWVPAILQYGETRGNLKQKADKAFLGIDN